MEYIASTEDEREYLKNYDSSVYPKPSVTADVVVMTLVPGQGLGVILVRRNEYPYKGKWSLPGGFVGIEEDIEATAERKLMEKAGVNVPFYQFGTFGKVGRDPRMRVISVSHMAFVPMEKLSPSPGIGADDAGIFLVKREGNRYVYEKGGILTSEKELAFDHADIIRTAIERLRNRISYTDDAFAFVDKNAFTIAQLREIYEAVKGEKVDFANFRRDFTRKYEKTGLVEKTNTMTSGDVGRPSAIYRFCE